jgi:hypothetical protein
MEVMGVFVFNSIVGLPVVHRQTLVVLDGK